MNRKLRAALLAVLSCVFLASAVMLVRRTLQYREGEETYAEAETLAGVPDLTVPAPAQSEPAASASTPAASSAPVAAPYVDPYARQLQNMDFAALREVNPEILGWLVIPGTPISYPLVQGADNEYYLTHTWKKTRSAVGTIFLEQASSPDFSDFNTIVYGHRMNNGSMFAALKYYKKQSYWKAHPAVYVTDNAGTRRYDIFAAYEVSTQGETYRLGFSDDGAKQSFLDVCAGLSVISTGVTPTVNDRILTLSTCTGNGHATRWVVQARERGEAPAAAEQPPETEERPASSAASAPPAASTSPAAAEPAPASSGQTPASSAEVKP